MGYLYKRRDTLRGRFAYRRRYAVLRFPPATTNANENAMVAGGSVPAPPPPTLSLLKGLGSGESEKTISLKGAEVTLGTAKSGDLFPFVITFPSLPAQEAQQTQTQTRSRSQSLPHQPPHQSLPSPGIAAGAASSFLDPDGDGNGDGSLIQRRNTDDFIFPGTSIDPADAEAVASASTTNQTTAVSTRTAKHASGSTNGHRGNHPSRDPP
ncbi:unnamed protein product, partial [Sphacelaria rigidula]